MNSQEGVEVEVVEVEAVEVAEEATRIWINQ
jgi:hypothetical protein